jgi:dTDP-4-amino-4,6-dideoxygalactose transaminase
LKQKEDRTNARHIYVIFTKRRDTFRGKLAINGVGSQVHYKPITLQSFYNCPGCTPRAEEIWNSIVTIPLYPQMSSGQQRTVIKAVQTANEYVKKLKEKQ